MVKINVYNKEGKVVKEIEIDKSIFDSVQNKDVLYYYVKAYLANQREGNSSTKTRSDVAGSNKKPWKQKGTGQARAGTRKSPIWRGGGVIFGPKPRDYRQKISSKVKKVALISALTSKYREQKLIVIDEFKIKNPKTKEVVKVLDNLKLCQNVLIATEGKNETVYKSARNIEKVEVRECENINAYDILKFDKLLLTETAIKNLQEKLSLGK